MVEVEVKGLDEVVNKLEHLGHKYPDKAGEILQENAKAFRKEVVANMRADVKSNKPSKKSLRKVGTYRIMPVRGYGLGQEIDISAKAPHFHLYEHGHNQTNRRGTKVIGHVEGRKTMKKTADEYKQKYPEVVENMVSKLLKEEGLT